MLLRLLLGFVLVLSTFQSVLALTDMHQAHTPDAELIQLDHKDHVQDDSCLDCNHCCHCHPAHTLSMVPSSIAIDFHTLRQNQRPALDSLALLKRQDTLLRPPQA